MSDTKDITAEEAGRIADSLLNPGTPSVEEAIAAAEAEAESEES